MSKTLEWKLRTPSSPPTPLNKVLDDFTLPPSIASTTGDVHCRRSAMSLETILNDPPPFAYPVSSSGRSISHKLAVELPGEETEEEAMAIVTEPISPASLAQTHDASSSNEDIPLSMVASPQTSKNTLPSRAARPIRRAAVASAAAVSSVAADDHDEDEEEEEEFDSPPSKASKTSLSNSPTSRRISHSLIERRRREKINDCLAKLRAIVPQCQDQLEAKEAKADQRSRRRGEVGKKSKRKRELDSGRAEEGEHGGNKVVGLHKLEILLGTLEYIEELESRVASLEGSRQCSNIPDLALDPSHSPALSNQRGTIAGKRSSREKERSGGEATDDAAALLLLNLASPTLAPVL